VAARLEEIVDALSAFPSFVQNEYGGQNTVRFHTAIYAARATNRYGAWVGFFAVASEVLGTPSFEVASKA
jgi:hypothetical protein